jgi:predicted Zn-dependent peptidase
LVIAAAGNLEHEKLRDLVQRAFEDLPALAPSMETAPPAVSPGIAVRHKDIEQSHICVGTPAYPQVHNDRHALYLLNTILGGSMSSRLFQHIREDRGLAYAVFSTLTTYTDAGIISVYAGCATEKVNEVIALTLAEMNTLREELVPDDELRRAKDHLKGSLMLGLESTSSRMSHVARQELYFRRQFTLDEMLDSIERVSREDVQRVARDLFRDDGLAATVVGPESGTPLQAERLRIGGR